MKICSSCGYRFVSEEWVCPRCEETPVSIEGFLSFISDSHQAGESFKPEYFPQLYELEKEGFWFRHRTRLILKAVETFFPSAGSVLDIGCGTGFVLSEIRQSHPKIALSGSDFYSQALHFAGRRVPEASLLHMDACRMPFEEEFDLILALDILEHLEDDFGALGEMFRSIKPGGGVIVTVPQHKWLWTVQDEKAYHRRRYSRNELLDKMKGIGFRIAHATSFMSLLLPLMMLSRGCAGMPMSRMEDPLRELKMRPSVNAFMGAVCAVEERILMRGTSLPAGGSLMCIGIKEWRNG